MPRDTVAKEQRIARNIYRTAYGWRVYLRGFDPTVGRSAKKNIRFKPSVTLEELQYFRDSFQLEAKRLKREARLAGRIAPRGQEPSGFSHDAQTYLELPTTKAMPSYTDRVRDIDLWAKVFRDRSRRAITANDIDQQLQRWRDAGCAASTVNHRRTALMALWTRLDGRGAANPVRETKVYQEPVAEPRGQPYWLIQRILDAIPAARTYSHKRETKVNPIKTRYRYEVKAWTGMRESQIGQLTKVHVNFAEGWYLTPRAKKGKSSRHPRPQVRKPLTADAAAAFTAFFEHGCEGPFSASSARRLFARAVKCVEQSMRTELGDPTFTLPHIRPTDLRHSYGTELLKRTKSLETVSELMDHTTTRMTKRYALGAMFDVLKEAAAAFQEGTTQGKRQPQLTAQAPHAPKKRLARHAHNG